MTRCKRATGVRLGQGTDVSAVTLTNPFTDSQGILCDYRKMCKGSRGLQFHQAKTNCQMPENKLIAPSSTQKQELFHIIKRCYSVIMFNI